MKYKLLIWDFDGVIADTEKLWMRSNCAALNACFNLGWDIDTCAKYLWGLSLKSKIRVLEEMGIHTDQAFWKEVNQQDFAVLQKGLETTPGVKQIFDRQEIKQCIATGGTIERTQEKLRATGLASVFKPDRVFCADMVAEGKPAPDLFLLAAQKMGEDPADCVVVEDSLIGLTAAARARMTPVAFMGAEMNNNPVYYEKVKALGIQYIYPTMAEVEKFIFSDH